MNRKNNIRGFSLLELSIVLVIVSVALGSSLFILGKYSENNKRKITDARIQQVMVAIKKYAARYNRLPCPANMGTSERTQNYGWGRYSAGNCVNVSFMDAGKTSTGMVPINNLGLYPSLALDGWGNRLRYTIRSAHAADNAFTGATVPVPAEYLTTTNYAGNGYAGVVVTVLSSGENAFRAYSARGSHTVPDGMAYDPKEDSNSSGFAFSVSMPYGLFDDIVYFWTYRQIKSDHLNKL